MTSLLDPRFSYVPSWSMGPNYLRDKFANEYSKGVGETPQKEAPIEWDLSLSETYIASITRNK